MMNIRFRSRILLVTVLPVVSASIILAYIFISGRVDEFNERTNDQGNNISSYLSLMSEYGVYSNNFEYLESILDKTLNQKNIVAIYIEDRDKSIVLQRVSKDYKDVDIHNIDKNINKLFSSRITKTVITLDDITAANVEQPDSSIIVGTVNIIMNMKDAKLLKMQIIQDGIITTLILTLITIFVALIFSRSVTRPIKEIYKGVDLIGQGDLQHRIPVNFSGELAVLAEGINNMTSSLEIASLNEKQRQEALVKAKQQAESANRVKSILLSSMSHEMRTPMNAILGYSQLIELDAKDENIKSHIREVIRANKLLLDMVEDMFDVSQIESDVINLDIRKCSLKYMIEFCISIVKSSAEEMQVKIDNKVSLLPEINVYVDDKRFKQIVINLLSNAIKYNNKNGDVIVDYLVDDENTLCLSVTDTGKGISPFYHKQIFNHFDRAGQEGSNIAGSGLGLAICKKLIEKMHGSIGFESTLGKGSRFWIKVPLA